VPLAGSVTAENGYNLLGDLPYLPIIQGVTHLAIYPPCLAFYCRLSIKSPLPYLFGHAVAYLNIGFNLIFIFIVTDTSNGLSDFVGLKTVRQLPATFTDHDRP
jgi:hypothetical protein